MNGESEWVDTKSRNILTLEERVRAIREYDSVPVYQKVADTMCCSAKQIRNIIQNRESILLYYASKTGHCQGGFVKHEDREHKIDLLNKVMYEWIQRTQSREDIGRISTKLIRTIALDVKNHIKIPSFYPNTMWLDSFMQKYEMTEDDLLSQKVYARSTEPKEHLSLKISDIVDDVKIVRNGHATTTRNRYSSKSSFDEPRFDYLGNDSSSMYENSASGAVDEEDCKVMNETEDDGYHLIPAKIKKVDTFKKSSSSIEPKFIASYEEALKHLKPLEDFVLLEENFRAIGVVSQLEAIFQNPSRFQAE